MNAYLAFSKAANVAEAKPPALGGAWPSGGDFTKYAFDPIRAEFASYLYTLNRQNQAWRGTPPELRLSLVSANLGAKPYPTVTLQNCPTDAPGWEQYDTKTGKVATDQEGLPEPPYLVTAVIIFHEGRWGVSKVTADASRTCEA